MKRLLMASAVLIIFSGSIALVQSCTKTFAGDGSTNGSPLSSNAQVSYPAFDKQFQEVVLIKPGLQGDAIYLGFQTNSQDFAPLGYDEPGTFRFRNVKDAKAFFLKAGQLNENNMSYLNSGQPLQFVTILIRSNVPVAFTE